MRKILLLFVLIFGYTINAQIISGKVLSNQEKQPIPYAKIVLENQNTGTIADEKGNFILDVNDVQKNTKMTVEVGGFHKYSITLQQFLKNKEQSIFLLERVKDIEEVKIIPRNFVQKNWGINSKTKRVVIGHVPAKTEGDGSREIAMLFKTKKKTKIEKININIATLEADRPVFVRFTVYDKNLNLILEEDLHDEITAEKIIGGTYSFDVSKNNIWVNNNFYVGIQLLNFFEGGFYMSGALMGNKTIYRKFQSNWEKIPVISPAINIDVKVEK